jgi:hypothetical protein
MKRPALGSAFLFAGRCLIQLMFTPDRAMQKIIPAWHGTFIVLRYYAIAGLVDKRTCVVLR